MNSGWTNGHCTAGCPLSVSLLSAPQFCRYVSALRSSELELWCSSAFFESSIPFILTHKMLPLFLHFLLFINACSFLSFPSHFLFPCFPLHGHFPFHASSYHHKVAQGRVWALRQVNPSSDNHRCVAEGGQEEEPLIHSPSHQPQHLHSDVDPQEQLNHEAQDLHEIHQTHDAPVSCGQCLFPSRPLLQHENEHQEHTSNSDLPEEHHLHQHDLTSSPPHPQPHLECVFQSSDLVDWLIERGLCTGRAEARLYCARLQLGGVLRHLRGGHSFRDEPTRLYHFTQGSGEGCSQNVWEAVRREKVEGAQ